MQFLVFFPQACSVVAFVLSILCLLAGCKPGFMESYYIIILNTSALGQSITSTADTASSSTASSLSFGSIKDRPSYDARSSIGGQLGGVLDNNIRAIAGELGIQQWYSMHLMNMCEGTYTPSATMLNAGLNVSSCTRLKAMYHFDVSKQLDNELQVGNLHLSLSDIAWPSDIQNGFNSMKTALSTLFILYIVGIATASISIITPPSILLPQGSQLGQFSKGIASLSFLSLLAASITVTFVQFKATDLINEYGNDIGVYASGGGKYMTFTWVAALVMFIAAMAEVFGERMVNWDTQGVCSAGSSQLDLKMAEQRG